MKKLLLLTIAVILFLSCDTPAPVKYQTISADGLYSLDIPLSYQKKSNHLNESASLEYSDTISKSYIIMVHEKKKNFANAIKTAGLDTIYTSNLKGFSEFILNSRLPKIKSDYYIKYRNGRIGSDSINDMRIGPLKARQLDIGGLTVFDNDSLFISYKFVFIEGKSQYYQLTCWTFKDRLQQNEKEMQSIIDSFKETDRSAAK